MNNYIQAGDNLTVTAPAAKSAGDGVKVGQIFGVAVCDAASGASVEIARKGVYTLPKLSTDVITAGDLLYWDNTNSRLTKTSAVGLLLVGVAAEAAGNGVATIAALLDGVARANQAA